MTTRPVFIPGSAGTPIVRAIPVSFVWYAGFSTSQKKRSIGSWHSAAAKIGLAPLLEVSTKSEDAAGRMLSAFNLDVSIGPTRQARLEAVYHACKVFEFGGPYKDLISLEPREAKRDPRLRSSGALVAFQFGRKRFPLLPRRAFYDWLYLRALKSHPGLVEQAKKYAGFTDIEFNPTKSVNSQAHAIALAVALAQRGWLKAAQNSFSGVATLLGGEDHAPPQELIDA